MLVYTWKVPRFNVFHEQAKRFPWDPTFFVAAHCHYEECRLKWGLACEEAVCFRLINVVLQNVCESLHGSLTKWLHYLCDTADYCASQSPNIQILWPSSNVRAHVMSGWHSWTTAFTNFKTFSLYWYDRLVRHVHRLPDASRLKITSNCFF